MQIVTELRVKHGYVRWRHLGFGAFDELERQPRRGTGYVQVALIYIDVYVALIHGECFEYWVHSLESGEGLFHSSIAC